MNGLLRPTSILLLLVGCASPPADHEERVASWQAIDSEGKQSEGKQSEGKQSEGKQSEGSQSEGSQSEGSELEGNSEPPASSESIAEALDLGQLLGYARAHNPGLHASFEAWKEALERVPQATKLPEPRLGLAGYVSEVETRVGPMQAKASLSQSFPWFGELEEAGNAAHQSAEAARENLEVAVLDLDQRVRDTWYEYAWGEQAIAISRGHLELLSHWEGVARSRLETGLGSHADIVRAQVELGTLEDQIRTLEDRRVPLVAKLNAALHRPAHAPLPRPSFPLPEPVEFDEARLRENLVTTSPTIRALEHRILAAEHDIAVADKAYYPDFSLGVDYIFVGPARNSGVPDSGEDAVALTLGLDLPVWRSSYRAGLREAEARLRRIRSEQDETWSVLTADLELAFYGFRDANRRVDLHRNSLIPKGEEAVEVLDTAYQSGDEGFLDLIDAQRLLLRFQLEAARAEADRAKALAKIERISGTSLHLEQ